MNKLYSIILILLFCNINLWAQESPMQILEKSATQIITVLEANKAQLHNKPEIVFQAVEKYLLPNVDVAGMSRSVLGRQVWSKASDLEKMQFSHAFTRLVIRTYASPLAEYTNEKIKFLPIRGAVNPRFMRINSIIIRENGKNISLSYSLVSTKSSWKIYDFSVEGISLLESFKSQFAGILKNSNINDLIIVMNNHAKAVSR